MYPIEHSKPTDGRNHQRAMPLLYVRESPNRVSGQRCEFLAGGILILQNLKQCVGAIINGSAQVFVLQDAIETRSAVRGV